MTENQEGSAQSLGVLVVDDDDNLRSAITLNLEESGYNVRSVASAREALEVLRAEALDIVLCDFRLPESDGIEFIKNCKQVTPDAAIVLMTGYGSSDLAIRALRAGAYDYIPKPFSFEELILTFRKIEEREQLKAENADLKSAITQRYNFSNIIAQSQSMKDVFETVRRLSSFTTTVLLTGESGTGKELLARAVHHNSPRRGKPFVAINCGAIPENLIESELFGHKKGAFTDATRDKKGLFEEADGGTLFLDEIGELPVHLQVKMLRALQDQHIRRVGDELMIKIDVRVIAATLRDLEKDVKSGRFRDDLFYRLNVVSIHLPALRDRTEDIPVLVQHFIKKYNRKLGLNVQGLKPEAMKCLLRYHWRGNVRELENCIERSMVLSDTDMIGLEAFPPDVRNVIYADSGAREHTPISEDNLSIKQRTRELEINLILKALKRTSGNRTHAAKILEISHRALLYKLKEYGLAEVEKS